jgi:hypothetical protein
VKEPDWVTGDCGKKNIMKRLTLHQGLEKRLMTENNSLFLIQQKKHFLKK